MPLTYHGFQCIESGHSICICMFMRAFISFHLYRPNDPHHRFESPWKHCIAWVLPPLRVLVFWNNFLAHWPFSALFQEFNQRITSAIDLWYLTPVHDVQIILDWIQMFLMDSPNNLRLNELVVLDSLGNSHQRGSPALFLHLCWLLGDTLLLWGPSFFGFVRQRSI